MKKVEKWLFCTAVATMLSGCVSGPTYYVKIDSITSTNVPPGKTYALLPAAKDSSNVDLQFKEFAIYIHRALRDQGFTLAEDAENADIAIFLGYGIGDPKLQTFSYSLPQWGQTGVSSSTTYGTVNTYGNHASYTGTTSYTPQYGIVGYNTFSGSHYEYFRWMLLDAYDLTAYKKDLGINQIWQTSVTSSGSSGDLRLVFPIMTAAATPFIGTNTGRKILINLHETDEEVMRILGTTPSTR